MIWASPKSCALAAAVCAALLAAPAKGGVIPHCNDQNDCIKWEVTKLTTESCGIAVGNCPVKVCLVIENRAGCDLESYNVVDYACDNANSAGCVRSSPWVGTGGGRDTSTGAATCDSNDQGSNSVCDRLEIGGKLCQVGMPGQTLYWNLYV
jgi:hypothetical protein